MPPRPLVIVGDEAFTEEEWEAEQRRRAYNRVYGRTYRERNRDRIRAYNRDWMRQWRASQPQRIGAFHDLSCTGPHKWPRKLCKPIPVWTR